MRRLFLGMAVALGLSAVAPASQAQIQSNFTDPFFLYYGWYLPRQAALAAQPTSVDIINQASVNRQLNATTERGGYFEPIEPFGLNELDPNRPFQRQPGSGPAYTRRSLSTLTTPSMSGSGPPGYYNRAGMYYPNLRAGHGSNANIYTARRRGGYGMGGMGGMGGGFY